MMRYKDTLLRVAIMLAAAGMILYGISRGEVTIAFNKAINICFECIGLG